MGLVQAVSQSYDGSTGATTAAVTISAVTSGSLVCGAVTWRTSDGSVSSVDDNQSNSYTVVRSTPGIGAVSMATFYRANVTNAPTVVTVTFTASALYRAILVHEVSNIATASPLDGETGQAQTAPGTGTDAVTSGTIATTVNGDYIFGAATNTDAFTSNHFTAGTGFVEQAETGGGVSGIDLASEDLTQSSSGTIAATFTQASNVSTIAHIMAFKPAGGAQTVTWVGYIG